MMNSRGPKEDIVIVQKIVKLENEALPSRFDMVKIPFCYRPANRMLCFNTALRALINQGYHIEESQIFFWDHLKTMFVYVGCFPNENQLAVPYQYFQEGIIQIRYRKVHKQVLQEQRQDNLKRVKQRSIKDAVEKVSKWMQLYQRTDKNGRRFYTLQSAANEVSVAKKTLDDYKTQIKLGQKYHFDFLKNSCSKIGVLRNYVKDMLNLNKLPSRPPSPQAQPIKFEAEAAFQMSVEEQCPGYLFHSTHSCYGSDTSSNRD